MCIDFPKCRLISELCKTLNTVLFCINPAMWLFPNTFMDMHILYYSTLKSHILSNSTDDFIAWSVKLIQSVFPCFMYIFGSIPLHTISLFKPLNYNVIDGSVAFQNTAYDFLVSFVEISTSIHNIPLWHGIPTESNLVCIWWLSLKNGVFIYGSVEL